MERRHKGEDGEETERRRRRNDIEKETRKKEMR